MLFFLLFELILVTLLAGVFGYLIAGKKGVLSLMSQVLVLNGLMLLIVWSARQTGWLPINHLDWRYWRWEDNYLSAQHTAVGDHHSDYSLERCCLVFAE